MNSRVLNRFLFGLVGLGALALLVPTLALGAVRPDDRSGPLGAVPATTDSISTPARPDDRAGTLGIGATSYSSSDDVFSRAVARHMATSSPLTAIRPDDRAGTLGIGATSYSYSPSEDVFSRAVARHNASSSPLTAIRPDDRAGMLGIGATSYSPSDDVFSRAVARHNASTSSGIVLHRSGLVQAKPPLSVSRTEAASTPVTSSSSDGFQWLDAAIGGAGVLAICMLVALGAVAVQRQHRQGAIAH